MPGTGWSNSSERLRRSDALAALTEGEEKINTRGGDPGA